MCVVDAVGDCEVRWNRVGERLEQFLERREWPEGESVVVVKAKGWAEEGRVEISGVSIVWHYLSQLYRLESKF